VPIRVWAAPPESRKAFLIVHPGGIDGTSAREASLVEPLRRQGSLVASLDAFNTGSARAPRDTSDRFFTTYNRTDDANRVQDVLTVVAWLKRQGEGVSLVGLERAGLWCLLAQALAPDLAAVVAGRRRLPDGARRGLPRPDLHPAPRSVGGFETALTLGAGEAPDMCTARPARSTPPRPRRAPARPEPGTRGRPERLSGRRDRGLASSAKRPDTAPPGPPEDIQPFRGHPPGPASSSPAEPQASGRSRTAGPWRPTGDSSNGQARRSWRSRPSRERARCAHHLRRRATIGARADRQVHTLDSSAAYPLPHSAASALEVRSSGACAADTLSRHAERRRRRCSSSVGRWSR